MSAADASQAHDPVHRPSHYTSGKVECIEAIEAALGPEGFIAFLRGQVIKYTWRMGKKDEAGQEAGKAKWYMDLLERKVKEAATSNTTQIQGAALTDSQTAKEISNGTVIDSRLYGTVEYLKERFGSGTYLHHSDLCPGWYFTYA